VTEQLLWVDIGSSTPVTSCNAVVLSDGCGRVRDKK